MSVIEVHARKQGVGTAVEELQGDVSAHISQQGVVAHSERILTIVAAGIPRVDSSQRTGIRSDECRDRKDTVSIFAAACGQSRNQGMAEAWISSLALAAVVQSVFLESLSQSVARGRADGRDAEIGSDSLAIAFGALFPLGRSVVALADAGSKGSASDRIRAERIECVVAKLRLLRRTNVDQVWLRLDCGGDRA